MRAGPLAGVGVDQSFRDHAAGDLGDELQRTACGVQGQFGAEALVEPDRGLAAEARLLGRTPDVRRVEVRRLEEQVDRRTGDFAVLAAHDAGQGDGLLGVGDDQHVGVELPGLAVDGGDPFVGARAPNDDAVLGEAVVVEGVERLPHLQHHEVGDVDDVVDRPRAVGGEPLPQPAGRRADRDAGDDAADVARAEVGVENLDAGRRCGGEGPPRRSRGRARGRRGPSAPPPPALGRESRGGRAGWG